MFIYVFENIYHDMKAFFCKTSEIPRASASKNAYQIYQPITGHWYIAVRSI